MKRRNPRWGCPRIAQQISLVFGIAIDKDVVRRILSVHYHPESDSSGPSSLTSLGHAKDSLWGCDLFRCESANAAAAPLQEDFPPAGTGATAAGGLRRWPLVSVAALIVLVAIAFLLGSRGQSSRADPTHRILMRLTSTPGLNADPALSPDGALLAYASDRGGTDFDIYVQAVAGGEPMRLDE